MARSKRLTPEEAAELIVENSKAGKLGYKWHPTPNDASFLKVVDGLMQEHGVEPATATSLTLMDGGLLESAQNRVTDLKIENAGLNEKNRELTKHVMFDPLTGAHSTIALAEKGQQYIDEIQPVLDSKRTTDKARPGPVTLVVADFDGFKQINDNCGHDAGDRALKHFVEFMKRKLRSNDFISRKSAGGDEFVFLYDGNEQQAQEKFAELRREYVKEGFKFSGEILGGSQKGKNVADAPVYLSFSFGTYQIAPSDGNIAESVNEADKKAIADKGTKKRRWEMWERSIQKNPDTVLITLSSVVRDGQAMSA